MTQAEQALAFNWRFVCNWTIRGRCYTMYRDEARGVQMERYPRSRWYFIDGDKREFKTEEELGAALAAVREEQEQSA